MFVNRPLFKPTYRLIGYCLFIGVCGGLAAVAFDWLVQLAQHHLLTGIGHYTPPEPGTTAPAVQVLGTIRSRWWIPAATTLGGLLSGLIVFKWAPEAEGHGTDAAVGAYHEGGQIRTRIPFIKAIASALTIGSGGVAGKEGPTAQISVGIGSILGRVLGLRGSERRALLLAGMAAGLAAIFRAPLGMAIFSVEILYSEMVFESESLIYTVIAAVTAYAVHGMFAGWDHIFFIPAGVNFDQPLSLVSFAVLGLTAGLLGAALPTIFYHTRDLFLKLPGPPHIKPAIGALMVGVVGMFVPEILGTGYGWVQLALVGKLSIATILLILLLKGPGLAATIGSGGSGGVFAPSVAIGAMLGGAVGFMMNSLLPGSHLPIAAFVVVGMAAVFAGAARTPISTLIMVAEMTGGYGLIVPAMLSNILSFLVQHSLTGGVKYPTLYESQVKRREDSPTHRGVFVRRAVEILDHEALEATDLTMPRLASLLRFGEPIPVQDDKWRLVTVRIEPGSAFAGRTVAETIGGISGTTAVAILRGDQMLITRGPTRLEAGDQLLAVTTPESHEFLQAFAQGNNE
jgi:CIC family chloride channel protein